MNVEEIIYDHRKRAPDDSIPAGLIARIKWLTDKLNSIPEPYRHTAVVSMEAFEEYDCHLIEYTISYGRPETDQEQADRIMVEERQKETIRTHELATLQRLKEKYE